MEQKQEVVQNKEIKNSEKKKREKVTMLLDKREWSSYLPVRKVLRTNKRLFEMGFRTVVTESNWRNIGNTGLTLHIHPDECEGCYDIMIDRNDETYLRNKYKHIADVLNVSRLRPSTMDMKEDFGDDLIYITEEVEKQIWRLGFWKKSMNLIVIYGTIHMNEGCLEIMLEKLKKFIDENKITTVEINWNELLVDKLMDNLEKHSKRLVSENKSHLYYINQGQKNIQQNIASYSANMRLLNKLKECKDDIRKELATEIERIRKLNFVTNVYIDGTGLCIELKEISLRYIDEKNKIDELVNMGKYTIHFNNAKIEITGDKYIESDETHLFYHPHVYQDYNRNDVCYGTFGDKINELLSDTKYYDIVVLINIMLKDWNVRDKYLDLKFFYYEYNKNDHSLAERYFENGNEEDGDEDEDDENNENDENGDETWGN